MGLESATAISDLVATNPASTDTKKQGDDHLRLIKAALQYCFPNATKRFYFPTALAKSANFSILASHDNCTFVCDTTTAFSLTLPTLASGDAGWSCYVVKTTTDANPVFLVPPSGTINGFTKVRRAIPYVKTKITWLGTGFVADRAFGVPIGSGIPFYGSLLPPGCLWPDGTAFSATDFVELYDALGSTTRPDMRGRLGIGRGGMGGPTPGRVTLAGSGINGDLLGASGGSETHTLTIPQLPIITPAGSIAMGGSASFNNVYQAIGGNTAGAGGDFGGQTLTVNGASFTASFTGTAFGGGVAHPIMPPSLVRNEGLVTE